MPKPLPGLPALREEVEALAPPLRAALSQRWAEAALAEHASVASFSRFSLHLQAVGAPPDLLVGAHEAALDELRHTQLCFTLASIYAGEPLAPGVLDLSGDLLGALNLPAITVAAVSEGCVGETVAALEASLSAEAARHEAVRVALEEIARDEAAHAQLAWRFLRWALSQGDPAVEAAARGAFQAAIDTPMPPRPPVEALDEATAAHGRLGEAARHDLRVQAADEVLRPTLQALFG